MTWSDVDAPMELASLRRGWTGISVSVSLAISSSSDDEDAVFAAVNFAGSTTVGYTTLCVRGQHEQLATGTTALVGWLGVILSVVTAGVLCSRGYGTYRRQVNPVSSPASKPGSSPSYGTEDDSTRSTGSGGRMKGQTVAAGIGTKG